MQRTLDVTTAWAASILRLGAGLTTHGARRQPEKPLELYEFEACPFCRKVREMLSMLDLDAIVFPCPSGGTRFRPEVVARGGKAQFPYLVDPNTGTALYESDAINRYLAVTYGDGKVPLALSLGPVTSFGSMLGSLPRPTRGRASRPSHRPAERLELYSFEASPYCRLVREVLCELELPYHLHNVAKGSPRRGAFVALSGAMRVPYLVDPNTGRAMFESAEIVAYLRETYGA